MTVIGTEAMITETETETEEGILPEIATEVEAMIKGIETDIKKLKRIPISIKESKSKGLDLLTLSKLKSWKSNFKKE